MVFLSFLSHIGIIRIQIYWLPFSLDDKFMSSANMEGGGSGW